MKLTEEEKQNLRAHGWRDSDIAFIEDETPRERLTVKEFKKREKRIAKEYDESRKIKIKWIE